MLLLLLACARPHSSPPGLNVARGLSIAAEPLSLPAVTGEGLVAEGAWALTRTDEGYAPSAMIGRCSRSAGDFGGYSGLEWVDGRLLAVSDQGHLLWLMVDTEAPIRGATLSLLGDCGAESVRQDGDDLWIVYEESARVERYRPSEGTVEMDVGWQDGLRYREHNTGTEAMAVLPDGRRLLLTSGPVEDAPEDVAVGRLISAAGEIVGALTLPLAVEDGVPYTPTELAVLPDGRVLLLERSWHERQSRARILAIDAAQLVDGATLTPTVLARLGPEQPIDNIEGMVAEPVEGGARIWLISDDNPQVDTGQRTLLMAFRLEETP